MTNPFETTCALCGTVFEAHPGSFIEVGFTAMAAPDDGIPEDAFVAESWMSDEHIAGQLGIQPDEMDQLMSGQMVETGAKAWCDKCIAANFKLS